MSKVVICLLLISILIPTSFLSAQEFHIPENAELVQNTSRSGIWGNKPKVSLELTRVIGDLESSDENLMFYLPQDIAVDSDNNRYILDAGNYRILKFDKDWNFLRILGQEGQGPGELLKPRSIDIDGNGNIYVFDPGNLRMQIYSPEGRSINTISIKTGSGRSRLLTTGEFILGGGLPKGVAIALKTDKPLEGDQSIFEVYTDRSEPVREYGIFRDFGNLMKNINGSGFYYSIDNNDNTFVTFECQNRIEKYDQNGELKLRIERKLNYEEFIPAPEMKKINSGGRSAAFLYSSSDKKEKNLISTGIDVDSEGRLWVLTLKRQFIEDEKAFVGSTMSMDSKGGAKTTSESLIGNTELRETDIFELEIFNKDGNLLGRIPLKQFADHIRIFGSKLYLIDKLRGMQIYEYTITEN